MRLVQQFASLIRRPMDRPPFAPPFHPHHGMNGEPPHFGHHGHMPPEGSPRRFGYDEIPSFGGHTFVPDAPPPPEDIQDGRFTPHMHPGKMRILSILYREDGQTQREIADILGIRPPSLSEVLYKLEESGLIERRINEKDRRQSLVFITEEGRRTAESFMSEKEQNVRSFFSVLTEEERDTLGAIIQKLMDSGNSRQ